uniref:G-protein coupled receptors family 1 profile domain-containing protein n=1 Tax=Myripristis murdjan TaxID=586833 RepID=A0A667XC86_9TELE
LDKKAKLLNLFLITDICCSWQLHTPTNLLLLSLAVSDFLVGLLVMPAEILPTGACWLLGDFMCAVKYVVTLTIISASIGNMMLISVDRYVAICDPLCYPTKVTLWRVKLSVCLCWICSVFYSCLGLIDSFRQPGRHNSCHGECVILINYCMVVTNYIIGVSDFFITFFVPITVIVVLYMRVFVVAVSQARAMRSHIVSVTLQPSRTVTAKKSELKAARTLGVVVALFLMCFCPYYLPTVVGHDTKISASSAAFVLWLLYINSCLNPVIYALFYPWFRKSVKLIVTLQILQPGSCEAV